MDWILAKMDHGLREVSAMQLHTSRTCHGPNPISAASAALQMHKHSLILYHRQLCASNPDAARPPPDPAPFCHGEKAVIEGGQHVDIKEHIVRRGKLH